jgi:hypothetical protein
MKARCLVSFFAQDISGTQGTIIEVQDQKVFDELVQSGYVEAVDSQSQNDNVSHDPEQLRVKNARAKKVSDSHESQ